MTKVEWLWARCPICGCQYRYLSDYKPKTCGKFECVHKYLHPEVYGQPILKGGDVADEIKIAQVNDK